MLTCAAVEILRELLPQHPESLREAYFDTIDLLRVLTGNKAPGD
jgi:hypothetical protein